MVTRSRNASPAPVVLNRLLDRIDIHIEVPAVAYEKLNERRLGETSAAIRQRVGGFGETQARQTQRKRFAGEKHGEGEVSPVTCNADIAPALSTTG